MLNNKVILVPSKIGTKSKLSEQKKHAQSIASQFADMFGGSTVESVQGFYKDGQGRLINEKILKVYSYTDKKGLNGNYKRILSIARNLKAEMKQELIGIEKNNNFILI